MISSVLWVCVAALAVTGTAIVVALGMLVLRAIVEGAEQSLEDGSRYVEHALAAAFALALLFCMARATWGVG